MHPAKFPVRLPPMSHISPIIIGKMYWQPSDRMDGSEANSLNAAHVKNASLTHCTVPTPPTARRNGSNAIVKLCGNNQSYKAASPVVSGVKATEL